jgi:hypothetical protein
LFGRWLCVIAILAANLTEFRRLVGSHHQNVPPTPPDAITGHMPSRWQPLESAPHSLAASVNGTH